MSKKYLILWEADNERLFNYIVVAKNMKEAIKEFRLRYNYEKIIMISKIDKDIKRTDLLI